jgi:hypothetical protein
MALGQAQTTAGANARHEGSRCSTARGWPRPAHNPFNAIVTPRPSAGSRRAARRGDNLAPYSFFNAVAYTPPQVMFASTGTKPDRDGTKDSVANIRETGVFCVNIVEEAMRDAMNASSPCRRVDEFDHAGADKGGMQTIACARVAGAPAALECRLTQIVTLEGVGHGRDPLGRALRPDPDGRLDGVPMAFLPRHGRGHVHSPTSVPYRANIDALKRLGCTDIVAVSAVRVLREDYAPGDFVIVDQFIDRTFAREKSASSAPAAWPMSASHIRPVRACRPQPAAAGRAAGVGCMRAAPIWRWRGRSFPPSPKAGCTARSGARRDRHDRHARGKARPRGRALLCLGRHGHRLRLLARRDHGAVDVAPGHCHAERQRRGRARRWLRRFCRLLGADAPPARMAATAPWIMRS